MGKNSNDFRSKWVETEQQKDKCKEGNEMGINDIFKLNTLLLITILFHIIVTINYYKN